MFSMKFSNKKNMLIASALAGAILFSPMANTNVAYADDRPQIWGGLIGDDPHYFKLEPTSIKHLTVKGIHYISVWAVNLTEGGGSAWIPIIGMSAKDKAGYVNFIIKFEEDGTYHAEKMYYSKAKKLRNVMAFSDEKMEQDWISLLKKRYNEKNDKNYSYHQGEDIFNPRNWHYTGKKFQQSITDESARSIVEYLQQNHPEIIAENIAANKRDEPAILQQSAANIATNKREASANLPQHETEIAPKEQTISQNQTGYQRVFHIEPGRWDYMDDSASADIYIDFGNIQDASTTYEGATYTRYIVPVMLHNLSKGYKLYEKWIFVNRPTINPYTWGSFWVEQNMKLYDADWTQISVERQMQAEGEDIYCSQYIGTQKAIEKNFDNLDWNGYDYAKHYDLGILLKVLMYKKGMSVPMHNIGNLSW